MADFLVYFLLFFAIAIGFALGRWQWKIPFQKNSLNSKKNNSSVGWSQSRYFEGLTHLLNEHTDDAVSAFIEVMEVNSETLETHLALGKLMRRKGELAKAVSIHQNLLGYSSLSKVQHEKIQLELGMDYLSSGLLDRAESLLKELSDAVTVNKEVKDRASELLVEVYQDMGDWLAAIDRADQLTEKKFLKEVDTWRTLQAYFATELALQSFEKQDWPQAHRWVRDSLRYDDHCIRALLIQAELDLIDNNVSSAFLALESAASKDSRFMPELLQRYKKCALELTDQETYCKELKALYELRPSIFLLSRLELVWRDVFGVLRSVELLSKELPRYSQYPGVAQLCEALAFYLSAEGNDSASQSNKPSLIVNENAKPQSVGIKNLYGFVGSVLDGPLSYCCERCGYEAMQINWQCPSCKSWGSSSARLLEPLPSNE